MSNAERTVLTWCPTTETWRQFPEGLPRIEGQQDIAVSIMGDRADIVTLDVQDAAPVVIGVLRASPPHVDLETRDELILADLRDACPAPLSQRRSATELAGIAMAHWLRPGVVLTGNGPDRILSEPMSEEEARSLAAYVVADRARQDCLAHLAVLGTTEDGNRFLRDRAFLVNDLMGTAFPVPGDDREDLIVEVALSDAGGRQQRMTPVRGFLLSRAPAFDYDSATLTGVSAATNPKGARVPHDTDAVARLLMHHLPEDEIGQEDARYVLGCALDKLT